MKINDFTIALSTVTADTQAQFEIHSAILKANQATCNKDDLKIFQKNCTEHSTRLQYLARLSNEKSMNKCAQFIKDEAMLRDIASDSYALAKYASVCTAIVAKSKSLLEFTIAQAIAHLVATDFAELTHDTMRKQLTSKTNASEAHKTDRQASMICKLFERLNVATRTKFQDKKSTSFNRESALIKAIESLYE